MTADPKSTVPEPPDVVQRRHWATNLLIVVIGVVLFAALTVRSGRVESTKRISW